MAVTETPSGATAVSGATTGTSAGAGASGGEPVAGRAHPTGLAGVLGSGDHKVIGRAYIVASLLFGLAAAVTGELVAVERVDTSRLNILSTDTAFQVFTFHSVTATFLFLLPLVLGLGLVVVPLQVGSRTVAFPRAAAASFWTWLIAGVLVVVSYAINGGPGGGRARGVDLWTVALAAVILALVVGAACIVATVFGLRAPGMGLGRVPMFSWSMLVAGAMWLLTLPVLFGILVLVYVDHRHGRLTFGRNDQIYGRILWALRHPQVYAYAVPVLGFAADVFPVNLRTRQLRREVLMGAIAAFGILSFGAFVQASLNGQVTRQPAYIGVSILAVLPVLACLALWADLFRRGKLSLSAPLLYAVAAVLMLLVAVLAGAAGSIPALDVRNSVWDASVTHYATLAAVIATLGGLHWWATKIIGRRIGEGLGRLAALVLLLGTVLLAFPDLLSALLGDRSERQGGIEALNAVSALGGLLVAVGVLAAVANTLSGLRRRRSTAEAPQGGDGATSTTGSSASAEDRAPADPWDGHTLEWATASPPPLDNFVDVPVVGSAEPLLDQREEAPA